MQLYVKVITVLAGTSQPAIDPRMVSCPPDVEPDTMLSFLTRKFGEPIDTVWTPTGRHPRLTTGWVFPGRPATGADQPLEVICVPFARTDDGALLPMFELQADQRQEFERLAADGAFSSYTVVSAEQRDYQPPASAPVPAEAAGSGPAAPNGHQAAGVSQVHQILTQAACDTGATLYAYPRPARAVRRIVLRETEDAGGSQYEAAQTEDDGTLRIIGHDRGPGVTAFFGAGVTSYEWTYAVPPERLADLVALAGGPAGQDPLDAVAAYYRRTGGHLSDLLASPQVGATFSNWHS